ncbi:uncharacterized protein LOC114313574 [Camellia sinensis]|uniref:uncharacterized protein LOC114313574 n=1 Tax=Camellia sinensis TaxID=4442 RepID=UPI001036C3A3|nr:uncharacterized protein LOC114313574 [Camellia sinensis]
MLIVLKKKMFEGKSKGGTMDAYVTKGRAKQQTLNQMVKQRELVIRDICRVIYGHALVFNLVKSPLFKKMLKSVGEYGVGLKPHSYHEVRVYFLKKEVDHVNASLEVYRKEWKKTDCTIISNGWIDGKFRSLTNFLVNSPSGTVFIKSINTSIAIKNSMKLFEMLDDIVNEIGEEDVVQVVTYSASAYVGADRILEEKRTELFWSPCAAHCIDLMLSDIGELTVFKDTIIKAKEIAVYNYRHAWVLDLFRKFIKKIYQKLVIRVLSLTCSATGCERNWSTFDHVHSKKRNRLEQQWLNALVFVKYNIQLELRQIKRQERGETCDPICLSDMESDDEWITEKEDPCLLEDHSWMDIQECFKDDEGATSSKKRKRGPRNLNADRGKSKVFEDDDEIELIEGGEEEEEEEEEEEFDEVTMVDDEEEDDSDIDLGDDD